MLYVSADFSLPTDFQTNFLMLLQLIHFIAGIIWIGFAASGGAPAPFVLFGVLFVVAAIVGAIISVGKAARYQDAQRSYQQRREEMLRQQPSDLSGIRK